MTLYSPPGASGAGLMLPPAPRDLSAAPASWKLVWFFWFGGLGVGTRPSLWSRGVDWWPGRGVADTLASLSLSFQSGKWKVSTHVAG